MEVNIPILSVKLKMPQPRKNYIIRHSLFEQLNHLKDCKVVIVKAGAGSGKTTLLSSFVIETGLEHVRWISLDENANQTFVFWNYMIESVKDYLEDSKTDFQNFFDGNMQKENLWKILSLLVNKLSMEKEIVLVLDDFHMISDEFLISTINFFVENMPENMHLVLLTREMPEIYLGEVAIEDKLMVIDEDDVRLSEKESREFLVDTLKLKKEQGIITSMIEISEGWIGGLQLLAISSRDRNVQTMASFKVSNRVLNDYITKEIFEFLSEEEQGFLTETSILRYFNQKICGKYKPEIDFIPMMEAILQKNLFVINIDEVAGLYRYHAIMAEYLNGIFEKLDQEKKIELHNLAASIYEQLGDFEECLYHLFQIKDYEKIMKLILKMPQTVLTFSYLMKVPMEEISKNTDFAYQYFFYYYSSMDEEACERIYGFITANMKEDETFEAFNRSDMFFSARWDFSNSNILSLEQINKLPLNSITTAFLLIKEAYFLYADSKFQQAIDYLNCAGEVYKKTGNIYIGFFVLSEKAQILEDMGELSKCVDLYKEMEPMVSQIKSLACSYYIGIAGLFIRQLFLDKAFEMLENARKCMKSDANSIDRAYQYTLAEYYYLSGDDIMTEKLLLDVMGQEAFQNIYYSGKLLRYPIYRGQHSELAKQFATMYAASDDFIENMDCDLLYTSIQYELGNKEKAMDLVEVLIAKARKIQNKLKIVEGDLLKARMLLENQGNIRDIQNLFLEAVSYAIDDRIANPFWFERKTANKIMLDLKTELKKELTDEEFEFVSCVLSADPKHGMKENTRYEHEKKRDDLTEREKEVLHELSYGSTNIQIAEKLCVSLATVKTHINNIYGKLGVNNRVAAVNKIRT
ncbi:LuxR C-terminal-related transcriptional regulator [[Clostridium] fimetarium]|uniref:LuxR family transcriptional regulator, maltose regulon positive regulatory protein n=1 Tax=[Clostridium] fimetarium TaxID=99656 RepID=A0A1I0PJK6_9FIRM|nr:LuxR C-terminal-related transcriptional regulator [[Clostridium] fimetarium]SEW14636.1 LuxR family transcriptional regulator, maltose regulon positive regulatory protein [[Clostridium] fimetarium]